MKLSIESYNIKNLEENKIENLNKENHDIVVNNHIIKDKSIYSKNPLQEIDKASSDNMLKEFDKNKLSKLKLHFSKKLALQGKTSSFIKIFILFYKTIN